VTKHLDLSDIYWFSRYRPFFYPKGRRLKVCFSKERERIT